MSFIFDVNKPRPEMDSRPFPAVAYQMKEHLKTVGWTVPQSSTGSGGTWDDDDLYTSPEVWEGASEMWFRLRAPDGSYELLFQRDSSTSNHSDSDIDLYYSEDGFTEGSPSATDRPTASDEVQLQTTSDTIFWIDEGAGWTHCMAEDEPPYRFWVVSYEQGDPETTVLFVSDYVLKGDPDDPNPRVFCTGSGEFSYGEEHWRSPTHISDGVSKALRFGKFSEVPGNVSSGLGNKDTLAQAVAIGSPDWKGVSSLLYVPLQTRPHGSTYKVNGQERSHAKFTTDEGVGFAVDWDGESQVETDQ